MDFKILINNNLDIKSVLDVGAHAGTFTFGCKQFYPEAYYYMMLFTQQYPHIGDPMPYWMPKWSPETSDPSARTLALY